MGEPSGESLCVDGLARVELEVERFERLTGQGSGLALQPYWNHRATEANFSRLERLACLGGLVKSDLRRRFDRGDAPTVHEYLDDFPELRETDSRVLSLVYEEFCLREEHGESLDVESFCNQYPDWRESLASQLAYHRLLSQAAGLAPPRPDFPEVGSRFEEFTLLAQIGKGGYSRVFLASDRSLGGKRVVLKVSLDRGQEAETQGMLDHPHIVPVNSVVYQPDRSLRGLSMPYRPGLPLDEVIRRLRRRSFPPTSAMSIWESLAEGISAGEASADAELAAALQAGPISDGWRGFPVYGTFAQGAAWIGMVIARALAYAHDRRTYHRDVKPGNVLLTVQHGPQLLDFNLAQSPHSASEAQSAIQGGTLPYMAPEQIEAFLNPERWSDVGAAADIYSLGLVMRELLTGQALDVPDSKLPPPRALQELLDRRQVLPVAIRRHLSHAPYALEAIVVKCLRHVRDERYPDAKGLADDLDRMLRHQPLALAVNPSRAERVRDWATRNRRLLLVNAIYLTLLAALAPMLVRQAALALGPDLLDRPELSRAEALLHAGDAASALPLLDELTKEYPSAPLPEIYRGIAHALAGTPPLDPGRASYADALKSPRADADLRERARIRPYLASLLVQSGNRWVDQFSELLAEGDDPERRPAIEQARDLAEHALSTALELDPQSSAPLHGLATIDESRARYDDCHEKLSRLLAVPTPPGTPASELYRVMTWRFQRARAAAALANQLEATGSQETLKRALTLSEEAAADLDACAGKVPDFLRSHFLSIRMEVLLTRGDLRHRLGDNPGASRDAQDADRAMREWHASLRSVGRRIPADIEDRYRRRLRDLQSRSALADSD